LLQLPEITKELTVLALYGTNGLTEEHGQSIKEWANGSLPAAVEQKREIIFFFDGDKAGEEAIKNTGKY
jgi:DNA primase